MPTVEKGRELWFLGLFLGQYVGGLALIYWLGLRTGDLELAEAGALATALIIMSTAHAVAIVEGIAMLAESFLKRRYEAGLQEGRAEAGGAKRSSAGRSGTGDGWRPRPGANGLRNRRRGSSGDVDHRPAQGRVAVRAHGGHRRIPPATALRRGLRRLRCPL